MACAGNDHMVPPPPALAAAILLSDAVEVAHPHLPTVLRINTVKSDTSECLIFISSRLAACELFSQVYIELSYTKQNAKV